MNLSNTLLENFKVQDFIISRLFQTRSQPKLMAEIDSIGRCGENSPQRRCVLKEQNKKRVATTPSNVSQLIVIIN